MCTYTQLATEHAGVDHVVVTVAALLVAQLLDALIARLLRLGLPLALFETALGLLALGLRGCLALLQASQYAAESFVIL
jgi:hypothetical protein